MTDLLTEILEYLPGPRSGPYEHELACKRLRTLLLFDRIKILKATLPVDLTFTLKIAKNAVGPEVLDREFIRPGLLTGDIASIKYYLRYCADPSHGFMYLEALANAKPRDYVRLSRFAYYYPLYLGRNAKPRRAWFKTLMAELHTGRYLDFNGETWAGGPQDIDWFVDVDSEHRVWFPPIREMLDKRAASIAGASMDE
jgi:hypothetical protein